MKKIMMLACLVLFAAGLVQGQKTIIYDSNAAIRVVEKFSSIVVTDGIDVYLSQGEEEAVAVSAVDAKTRDNIKVTVEQGVLKIGFGREGWTMQPGNRRLKAYISFQSINSLKASGASDVFVSGMVNGDSLHISLSGASDFKGNVALNTLNLDQSGASDATISGKVGNLQIRAGGASDLKGYDLATENCTASASGASDIRVTVNKALTATASGASSIYYKGSGIITTSKTSGASNVSKKG